MNEYLKQNFWAAQLFDKLILQHRWIRRLNGLCILLIPILEGTNAMAFSFSGPEVLKLDWGTRSLNVNDVNNDGRNDLVVINNDTSQIEILYQLEEGSIDSQNKIRLNSNRWEPILEDARFESKSITIGFPAFDLAVGDLNGDGLSDLAYTGREIPLTIRYQSKTGNWTETEEFNNFEALGWTNTINICDIDGDGNAELVVIAADALRIFSQGDNGQLDEAELYYITGKNPFNLMIEDVTNDGLEDILYITSDGTQSLALREQLTGGKFGPEYRFSFERPVRSVHILPQTENKPASFCSVDSRSGGIDFFSLKKTSTPPETKGFSTEQPEIYPIFKKGRSAASYELGDINGDGLEDLLVANPESAELMLFLKQPQHFLSPQTFPSFSEISSMASGRFFENDQDTVVILSAKEQIIGISQMHSSGRMLFPQQLQIGEGDPLVCSTVNLDNDNYDELALVYETEDTMSLVIACPADRKNVDSEWIESSKIELNNIKRKPTAIREIDIFGDNRRGLMVFIPREAPILLASTDPQSNNLKEIAQKSTVRESLLKDIKPAQITVLDVNEDGINELIVGRTGYARALQVTDDGLEIVDQFNALRNSDEISALVPFQHQNGSTTQLILYVENTGEFQSLKRSPDGVFRYQTMINVGKIDLNAWYQLSNNSSDEYEFIFAGEDRFWRLTKQSSAWSRTVEDSYETDLEEVYYSYVESADFDQDGYNDLFAVDGKKHVLEIISQNDTHWYSRMFWEIFEQNLHYQGRNGSKVEPRQIVIADLTNDGKTDFAFLIHDRILFYPQE